MFNLIQLFLRLSGFFVFVLLEVICFSLVVKYNQTQREIYVNSVNVGTGLLHKMSANTQYYFSLDEENYRLSRENARLLEVLYNRRVDTTGILDTMYAESNEPRFTFTPARVIKNTVNNHHNYLILDVGKKDGVQPHTGVVTQNGVAGIIRKVSGSYSVAMSVLHRQMRLSARIRSKHFFGSLSWKEADGDIRLFSLNDIPKHAEVEVGDTIETSGYSNIFPEGIFLGTVESVQLQPGDNFHTIDVKTKLDMTRIQHVYVVRNLLKKELESLEQEVREEDN